MLPNFSHLGLSRGAKGQNKLFLFLTFIFQRYEIGARYLSVTIIIVKDNKHGTRNHDRIRTEEWLEKLVTRDS